MPGHKITMLPDEVVQTYTLQEGQNCPALSLYVKFDEASLNVLSRETRLERVHIVANLRHDRLDSVVTDSWLQSDAPDTRIPGDHPASALEGRGRFSLECYLLGKVGLDVAKLAPQGREAATFYFDGLFPFMVLLFVSYLTRPTDKARVDQFYGKMKTPVGDTPELEAAAMEETRRNPGRFDHTKLVRDSTWEFCKWDRVDTIGFLICCAVSGAIIGIFVLLLKWAA